MCQNGADMKDYRDSLNFHFECLSQPSYRHPDTCWDTSQQNRQYPALFKASSQPLISSRVWLVPIQPGPAIPSQRQRQLTAPLKPLHIVSMVPALSSLLLSLHYCLIPTLPCVRWDSQHEQRDDSAPYRVHLSFTSYPRTSSFLISFSLKMMKLKIWKDWALTGCV